ncbi:conserved hypothetical protein [Ricinus communis]|uniref:Uncharacterized protein n=1 Tax=Ricinus communis TaxID=3988 RepID=B9RZ01_RICCO|nr:conserved hypothetical protein [Ricinus communis]
MEGMGQHHLHQQTNKPVVGPSLRLRHRKHTYIPLPAEGINPTAYGSNPTEIFMNMNLK